MTTKSQLVELATLIIFLSAAHQVGAYYDPSVQRWINRDPLEESGAMIIRYTHERSENNATTFPFNHASLHEVEKDNSPSYTFVFNNPVTGFDPKGLDCPGCDGIPAIFESPAVLECCALHDRCYDVNRCTAASWLAPRILCFIKPLCQFCNDAAAACIATSGLRGDDPTRPNYYCAIHGVFFNNPASLHMNHCN